MKTYKKLYLELFLIYIKFNPYNNNLKYNFINCFYVFAISANLNILICRNFYQPTVYFRITVLLKLLSEIPFAQTTKNKIITKHTGFNQSGSHIDFLNHLNHLIYFLTKL